VGVERMDEERAIKLFTEILQFPTVSVIGPDSGSYHKCGQWLLERCSEIGLDAKIISESKENKPIVVAEWLGNDPTLPCIFLNSHYDVVPIIEGSWTVPPFEGHRENGRIYGRGAQDMKCVVVQYLIAIERLKQSGYSPLRTLRLSFVPDEEIGGVHGMKVLMNSQWFSETAIAIALDEVSLPSLVLCVCLTLWSRVSPQRMNIIRSFMGSDCPGGSRSQLMGIPDTPVASLMAPLWNSS
jgi:aminoacylase